MDVRLVNSFIQATRSVIGCFFTQEIKIGELSVREDSYPSQEVNVILGVIGKLRGQIIYGLSYEVACVTVSKMMNGAPIAKMDDMGYSAISELANMISGNAAALLGNLGVHCNITPPFVVTGENVEVHTLEIKALVIPLHTEAGQINIHVALEEV